MKIQIGISLFISPVFLFRFKVDFHLGNIEIPLKILHLVYISELLTSSTIFRLQYFIILYIWSNRGENLPCFKIILEWRDKDQIINLSWFCTMC